MAELNANIQNWNLFRKSLVILFWFCFDFWFNVIGREVKIIFFTIILQNLSFEIYNPLGPPLVVNNSTGSNSINGIDCA